MATLLQRLAMLAFRHKRAFLAGWLLIMFVVVGGYAMLGSNINSEFTIPGSSSQNALNELQKSLPRAAGTSAQIVFESPAGTKITDPNYHAAVEASLAQAKTAPQVAAVIDPFTAKAISPDGAPRSPRSSTRSAGPIWNPTACRRWSTRPIRPRRPD